jgi:hypothetical protein
MYEITKFVRICSCEFVHRTVNRNDVCSYAKALPADARQVFDLPNRAFYFVRVSDPVFHARK